VKAFNSLLLVDPAVILAPGFLLLIFPEPLVQ
jgi:hypothetical protein